MKAAHLACFILATLASARAETDFFEKKVRPLLIKRCESCHGAEKVKGGLRLDSRNGWARGGDSGPAIIPGKPESSLLIKAVSYADADLKMPPKARLPEEEMAVLAEWIRQGAPDPREGVAAPAKRTINIEEGRKHWAFQPLKETTPPPAPGARNEIDLFVAAKLHEKGLPASPRADTRTLIRRLYFDLIGLPPTYEEVEAFAHDVSPDAFARLVDRLLKDGRYCQRWGRHWLDVARYADTTEQSVDGERRIPFAHTYRDYVIDAFNNDKPYNRFILEQMAADKLPDASPADLRALGFYGVGRQFASNADGPALRVDDRIDTVGRGFLGLTLACARCHDHKFDVIPTKDYYSLYGILDSFEEPLDLPAVTSPGPDKKRADAIAAYEAHVDACLASSNKHLRDFATEYLEYIVRSSPNHRTTAGDIPLDTPRGWLVYHAPDRWAALLAQCKERNEPFFRFWHQCMALPKEGFAGAARKLVAGALHPKVVEAFTQAPPQTMLDVADTYGALIATALKTNDQGIVDLVFGKSSPVPPRDRDEIREDLHRFLNEKQLVNRSDGEKAGKLLGEVHVTDATGTVDRAMTVKTKPRLDTPHVFIRGDMKQPGDAVPRRFLQVLSSVDDRHYKDDGRLQLAQAIASPKNPLTARVLVNRVWQHHFGTGLVPTPDDFGVRSEGPSHPELLDHLALWFMAHGWSIKELHRYILNSATWQQDSKLTAAAQVDPANRLLWRMTPTRLEFEPLRDSLLAVAGRLDVRGGGHGSLLADNNLRRAVYGYTDRYRIPSLLRNFDVANPDTSISRRAETLVPLQALFLMNNSFVHQQAEAVAKRCGGADDERLAQVFRLVLSRNPDAEELAMARDQLASQPPDKRWSALVQALFMLNEFTFVD